ncbi:MAG: endonuclease III [Victivallales bacterium]|nr:endonuclease III [Victivallales bacterium]
MLSTSQTKELYRRLAEVIDPKPELHFRNRLELIVAVVLSAQATDKSVNAATESLFERCKTPQDYLALGQAGLEKATRTIGLYRNKAKSILGLCQKLIDDFGGEVPGTLEELLSLPGVGLKTAYVVLNLGFGQPVIAVDTHIFRVANRTAIAPAKTPEEVSALLMKRTPKEYLLNAHHYLLLHGRYTCTARNPHCDSCVLADLCPAAKSD